MVEDSELREYKANRKEFKVLAGKCIDIVDDFHNKKDLASRKVCLNEL